MRKPIAVAFTGPSGSGKTTLIEKISLALSSKRRVLIVKHDPKTKADFDTPGKDSYRFFESGADVMVVSPNKSSYFAHRGFDLQEILSYKEHFDLLLIEGLKEWELPRIGIFRGEINLDYIPYLDAVAIDETVDIERYALKSSIAVLDLNDTDMIIEWIDNFAKEIR